MSKFRVYQTGFFFGDRPPQWEEEITIYLPSVTAAKLSEGGFTVIWHAGCEGGRLINVPFEEFNSDWRTLLDA